MKKIIILMLLLSSVYSVYAQKKRNTKTIASSFSNADSVSYALGMLYGDNLKKLGVEQLSYDQLIAGLRHVIESQSLKLTTNQALEVSRKFFEVSKVAMLNKLKTDNTDFLKKNATKSGVRTTASGLQYQVLKQGTGKIPQDTSRVVTHYIGNLIDGTEFDNSYKRNEPLEIQTNQVIKGWVEGLKLMSEGSKYRFFIPYQLAYGENGKNAIPPYSTLIFDVELLKVK